MKTLLTPENNLTKDARCLIRYFSGRLARRHHLDRDDLEQEIVLAALYQQRWYDPAKGALSTWLLHIVARRAVSRVIRQRRAMRGFRGDHPAPIVDDSIAAPDDFDAGPDVERIQLALDSLSPPDRQLVMMRFGIGHHRPHGLRELAGPLGVTWQAVWQRLRRVLRELSVPLDSYAD